MEADIQTLLEPLYLLDQTQVTSANAFFSLSTVPGSKSR